MILIIDFEGAAELADILRAVDISAVIRSENAVSEKELTVAAAAVASGKIPLTAARLKNLRDDLTVYTFGAGECPPFSDGHAANPSELMLLVRESQECALEKFFFSCGAAVDLTNRTAEFKGKTVSFSKSEIRIIRCILSSSLPLSASLVAEGCFGSCNTASLMTCVWRINKKFSSLTSRKLITGEPGGGYRVNK